MSLLLQLTFCLAAALLLSFALFERTTWRTSAIAMAVLAALVVAALGLKELWPADSINAAERHRDLSAREASSAGAVKLKMNADFVEWVVSNTSESDCYHLVARNRTIRHWVTYRMLPRLGEVAPTPGCWVVLYGVTPKKAGLSPAQLIDSQRYGPKFSIARLQTETGSA